MNTTDKIKSRGYFLVECFNQDGTLAWRQLCKNGATNAGLNTLLNVFFQGAAATTTWYLGLISQTGFSALSATDTMASHAGWNEATGYSQATRPTWTSGAASGQSITNAVTVDFSINATATINGLFLTSNNVKGGTTGTLWATGSFSAAQALSNGQTLKATYTTTMTAT